MTDETLHLYLFPASFFSQKIRIALEEKQLKYKETFISLFAKEQNEVWFLRINPQGQVPVLKIGDAIVTDSERILEAVDKLESGKGKRLVPDVSTEEGKLVSEWRKRFNSVDVENLSYGVMLNTELVPDKAKVKALTSGMTLKGYHEGMQKAIADLEAKKEKNPDLIDALDAKIATSQGRLQNQFLKEDIEKVLNDVEKVLDDVEIQLRKSRTENILEHWLCGPNYTAADIFLCVLLGRLDWIGLLDRYADPEKRPALVEYWMQAQQRPSVKKCVLHAIADVVNHHKKKIATRVAGGTAVAGAAVLLGVFIAKKIKDL
ncbi:ganglioside-induced differentiation-associated protein 1 [Aplysia californica]|uniref:Ganglioside-induced differentiation-associated protein 1 n=1 Tax=Aplysia californica TaxID=6500 RepID=A0ABM0JLY9_APLCA|nr:ganglioside-induced differentiation-associated protein 1 [Aplysia californica]